MGKGMNKDLELPLEGEVKYLTLEIRKLKSYITELEYKNGELIKIGKQLEKEKKDLQTKLIQGIPEVRTTIKKLTKEKNCIEMKLNQLVREELTTSERKAISKEIRKDSVIKDIETANVKLVSEVARYKQLLKKEQLQINSWFCEYIKLRELYKNDQRVQNNSSQESQNL